MLNGEPWWVAKDVAEILEYSWSGSSRVEHVPAEWRGVTSVVTPSGIQEMIVLSEQGLYFFLNRSDKQKALSVQKWIAGEVMPQIRKTGSYSLKPAITIPEDPLEQVLLLTEKLRDTAHLAIEYRNKNAVLTKTVEEQQPKVEAYNAFMDCDGNCSLEETAKAIGMGRNRMTEQLREKHIFYKKFSNGDNHVYQEFIDRGYFKVKLKTVDKGYGLSVPYPMIFTTPKGIEWLKMKVFSQSVAGL
jgi:prophage antirepressor-like protein